MIIRKFDYKICFVTVTLIGIVIIAIYNIYTNPHFFEITISNGLTLIVAIIIAYYFAQKKNDERKQKEKFEEVINKIQEIVTSESAYLITEETDEREILMLQRRLSQKIDLLSDRSKSVNAQDEIKYIYTQFLDYKSTVGNHINDKEYLHKSYPELKNKLDLIDNKCDEIKLKFY